MKKSQMALLFLLGFLTALVLGMSNEFNELPKISRSLERIAYSVEVLAGQRH